MTITNKLKRIEKQLGVGCNIQRTFLILGPPKGKLKTEADKAEQQANIDGLIKEAIQRDPKCPFFFMLT